MHPADPGAFQAARLLLAAVHRHFTQSGLRQRQEGPGENDS
jgi:hypothetical protein